MTQSDNRIMALLQKGVQEGVYPGAVLLVARGGEIVLFHKVGYRCLLPREVDGLIMGAGRSVNADPPSLLRAMALTMVVGQGAGTAAALAARSGATFRTVDVTAVQEELRRQGVEFD